MMAPKLERLPQGRGLTAAEYEHSSKSRPHTPPYTPNRSKVRLERADSPAPSIHPTETVSPAKKGPAPTDVPDTIIVQELVEGHPEYMTSVELVYPYELEEFDSEADIGDVSDSEGEGEDSDNDISGRLSQLQCEDRQGEAQMARNRRDRRESRRIGQRQYKRSHSQSIKSDSETTDADAMGDHDLTATARRLRRRTQGPDAMEALSKLATRDSPQRGSPTPSRRHNRHDAQRSTRRMPAVMGHDSDEAMDTSD